MDIRSSYACTTGLLFKGLNGEIPTIGEVPTIKISSDRRAKESSGSSYSCRAHLNFQTAVALACLHNIRMSLVCTSSPIWSQLLEHKVLVG